MRKLAVLLASALVLVGMGVGNEVAQAQSPCSTSGNLAAPASCDVTFSLTVSSATALTFTNLNATFGSALPGTDGSNVGGIAGNVTSNSSSTLAVTSCGTNPAAFASSGSNYTLKWTDGTTFNLSDPTSHFCQHDGLGAAVNNPQNYPSAGVHTFSLDPGYHLGASIGAGTYSQTITIAVS